MNHLDLKDKAWLAISIFVFSFGIGSALSIAYENLQPQRDWQAELAETEAQLIALNRQYYHIKDSLDREIRVRDNFVYSLTQNTWQYYPAIWDVAQKYRTYVRFHANYNPEYFKKQLNLQPYQAPTK